MTTALEAIQQLRIASIERVCRETGLDRRTVVRELKAANQVTWLSESLVAVEEQQVTEA